MNILATITQVVFRLFIIIIIVDVFMSYFLSPFHPVRRTLDQIVQPFLKPIQRFVPTIQGFDLSPIILLVLVQIVESLLLRLMVTLP